MGKLRKNNSGFSAVETILVLVVVAIIGFVGWYVWKAKQNADKTLNNANSALTSAKPITKPNTVKPAPTGPIFNTLPGGWVEYKSDANGLRLGYPKEWGTLDPTTLHTPDYTNDSQDLQGQLTITISKKEGFTVVARKYGATIKPSDDGKSWVVTDENPAAVDHYKVGDTYKTTVQKVNGGSAIDLSYTDEDCTLNRWLLELKNNYAVVSIPELCAGFNSSDRTAVSDTSKANFTKLTSDFLKTITIY